MADIRMAYQFHHLSKEAKNVARENTKKMMPEQFLYNKDGTLFKNSTSVYK